MEGAEGDASSVVSRSLMEVGSLGKLLGIPRPVNLHVAKKLHNARKCKTGQWGGFVGGARLIRDSRRTSADELGPTINQS